MGGLRWFWPLLLCLSAGCVQRTAYVSANELRRVSDQLTSGAPAQVRSERGREHTLRPETPVAFTIGGRRILGPIRESDRDYRAPVGSVLENCYRPPLAARGCVLDHVVHDRVAVGTETVFDQESFSRVAAVVLAVGATSACALKCQEPEQVLGSIGAVSAIALLSWPLSLF